MTYEELVVESNEKTLQQYRHGDLAVNQLLCLAALAEKPAERHTDAELAKRTGLTPEQVRRSMSLLPVYVMPLASTVFAPGDRVSYRIHPVGAELIRRLKRKDEPSHAPQGEW